MSPEFEADLGWHPRGSSPFRLAVHLKLGAECAVLFGASGAGKSSVLRLIAGLERPIRGRVRLGDDVLFDSSDGIDRPLRSRRIGLIFQDDLLFPHLNVLGNIRFGLKGWARAEASRRVEEVSAMCGVGHLLDREPATLSGGERQRVGLARAVAPRPRMLLCDEPVSALDLAARRVLIDRLRAVQQAESIPLLYVTHSPPEAIALGSRLFCLQSGRVYKEGPPLDVLAHLSATKCLRALDVEAADPSFDNLAHVGVTMEGVENRFAAEVEPRGDRGEWVVRLDGGPSLIVPWLDCPAGTSVAVSVRADDILLARGPIAGLSARNILAGTVVRLVEHGHAAEVVVRTGDIEWIVSVVAAAVEALGLCPGADVHMIVKARSCRVDPTAQ